MRRGRDSSVGGKGGREGGREGGTGVREGARKAREEKEGKRSISRCMEGKERRH